MKTYRLPQIIIIALVTCALMSCDNETGEYAKINNNTFEIPELLERNEAVANTVEWESRVRNVNASSAALIADPNDADALLSLAAELSKEARVTGEHGYYYPRVLMLADRALAQAGLSEDVRFKGLLIKSHTLLSQHRFEEAEKTASSAYNLNPYSADIYTALIDANVELGHYDKAAQYAQQLVDLRPGLSAYARASYIREIHGDVDGATWAMEQAVEAGFPGYESTEWARITLASLYVNSGQLDRAQDLYEDALEVRQGYPFAKAGLGEICRLRKDYPRAERLLKEALAAAPEIGFQEELFKVYRDWGKTDSATLAYEEILAMIEDDIKHGHRMDLEHARILLDYGRDVKGALALAEICYERRPDNIDVNLLLSRIYLENGDIRRAREHYETASRTGARFPELKQVAVVLNAKE